MFSLIIAAITEGLPLAISLAEKLHPKKADGAKTGADKFALVNRIARAIADSFALANGNSGTTVDDAQLRALIEASISQMKAKDGTIKTDIGGGQLYLVQGSVTPLKAG